MARIVQKYGGTSVADAGRIKAVARRVLDTQRAGNQVVVVLSARGGATDQLIAMAREISPRPPERELDMLLATGEQQSIALLAMALHAQGGAAVSLTGVQVGILTDSVYGKARIRGIRADRVRAELDQGRVVIVAGFQGVDEHDNITTLGRGGSDTTAVAVAVAVEADLCEIYTDVDGVYTADPRVVTEARKLARISHDEMLELASMGAGVLQSRSVEFAKKFAMPLCVRSSFNHQPGTIVCEESEMEDMEGVTIRGAALNRTEAKLTIVGVPDRPGVAAKLFGRLAHSHINVDMIVQNVSHEGRTDMSFTVAHGDLEAAREVCQALLDELGAARVEGDHNIAKVSVVGVGMRSHFGIASTMFQALAEAGVNIQMISTSEIKISAVVAAEDGEKALRAVHDAFRLGDQPDTIEEM
ncbi:MAG: aspartate kinase [Candidatus Brocadiia bacterium]